MNWFLIRRYAPAIVFLSVVFHYAYTLHQNDMLKRNVALLSENIKQQQIVLESIAVRTEEQERYVSRLKGELEAKQHQDTTKVKKLLSRPVPSGCADSIKYLKQEASNIVFD
jgi:hypothetical protein